MYKVYSREDAYRRIEALEDQLAEAKAEIEKLQEIVNKQAEDPGLWFMAQYASEAYLQAALRELHAQIEALRPGGK
jgi:DNA repair exonuclease SbcCD ATPase subunit